MSFQTSITPSRRAAARYIGHVRRTFQKALAEEEAKGPSGIKQSDIARAIGVNRSVIHRELRGHKDISLGRIAELAWALGRRPKFELEEMLPAGGQNTVPDVAGALQFKVTSEVGTKEARIKETAKAF